MKKLSIMLAALLCCTLTIDAQSLGHNTKMSPWLQSQYRQHQTAVKKNGGPLRVKGRPVNNYILTLVQSNDDAQTIHQKGGVVWQDFGNGICAAFLPMDSLEVLDQCPNIMRMEANEMPKLMNDTSAVIIGVDKAWDFEKTLNPQLSTVNSSTVNSSTVNSSTPQAFTGKGVIAAVMDVGFDFTHPAFRNEDGTSRIKWFWDPMALDANNESFGMTYTSPAEVLATQHCMNANISNHGCHVMGSMAGNGLDGRYVGMAPEADIMGAYIPLDTKLDEDFFNENLKKLIGIDWLMDDSVLKFEISDAIELVELFKLFEAADAAGQPCVVNWSFGSTASFFRDQTLYEEVFNQLVGPGRIVVTAAGNDGSEKKYVKKEAYQPMEQYVYYGGYKGAEYILFMRTEPEADFKVGFTFSNMADTLFINSRDVIDAQDTLYYSLPEVEVDIVAEEAVLGMTGFQLKLVFKGEYLEAMTDPEFGITKVDGNILIDTPVEVELQGSQSASSVVVFSKEYAGTTRGCNICSIGYPGSCERIITVGAMHHRSAFMNILGETNTCSEIGSQQGHLATFSSCGPTMNGRIKPDVVAPGHNIISTLNSFYRVNDDDEETYNKVAPMVTYNSNAFDREYGMWAMSGTSMASPIAAGVIALWLQAKPDLTPEDIKGVIERTSHQPEPEFSGTEKNVYYGWGEIDAYAGLLDILNIGTSIPELSNHQPAGVKFRVEGRTLYIDGLEDSEFKVQCSMFNDQKSMLNGQCSMVNVYDLSGKLITSAPLNSGSIKLPADTPNGVYAVQVGKLGSTLIRL